MSGKAKSKASKDKAKNETGQLAQTMSNGGQGVAMQCNPSGWVDSINANNACGQSGGIQQPQPQGPLTVVIEVTMYRCLLF